MIHTTQQWSYLQELLNRVSQLHNLSALATLACEVSIFSTRCIGALGVILAEADLWWQMVDFKIRCWYVIVMFIVVSSLEVLSV